MSDRTIREFRDYLSRPNVEASEPEPISPEFSDDALALEFAACYRDDLRYVDAWGKWLHYQDGRWARDTDRKFFDLARRVCREASEKYFEIVPKPHEAVRKQIASSKTVAAVLTMASSDRRLAAIPEQWDSDPWLVNTPQGALDLRMGELRPHRREDYFTRMLAVSPEQRDCPRWRQFLARVTDGNAQLQAYLQHVLGYCLTGLVREHVLFFLFGLGANGKTTFLNVVSGIFADYAKSAPIETFLDSNTDRHPTDLAGLMGARLVTAVETEEGRRWAESKLKSLTGGDVVSARFMRQDFFEYRPQFKLIIAGNRRPGLKSVDEAMARRFRLLPFNIVIPVAERDKELTEKLREEWPGILHWMVQGCLAWQSEGLGIPDVVQNATSDYMAGQDVLGQWVADNTQAGVFCATSVLHNDYSRWCEAMGERYILPQTKFAQALEDRGYVRTRTKRDRGFAGIAPKSEDVSWDGDKDDK